MIVLIIAFDLKTTTSVTHPSQVYLINKAKKKLNRSTIVYSTILIVILYNHKSLTTLINYKLYFIHISNSIIVFCNLFLYQCIISIAAVGT